MPSFLTPVDIANRALQHCGAQQISTADFSEQSVNSFEVSSCYDKLRQAELQRNTWKMAIRDTVLRAIDSNTALLKATLWSSSVTYFKGSIVSDQYGTFWESNIRDNLGNNPLLSTTWNPYFGPLTAALYDNSVGYYKGELVYIMPGDGTFKIYRSLVDSNVVDPSMPNQWLAATVYARDQVVQQFPAWSSLTTYSQGQGILYTDGNVYASLVGGNTGQVPGSSSVWALVPTLGLQTQPVPITGATLIQPPQSSPLIEWVSTTTYASGSVVMFSGTMYLAIAVSTNLFPNAPASTAWVAITNGTFYQSLIDFNYNNSPANSPASWASATTYALSATVTGSDGQIYTSLQGANTGNNPTTSPTWWQPSGVLTPWTSVFTLGGGNSQWLLVGGSFFPMGVNLEPVQVTYPVEIGPMTRTWQRNVFRLPAGYLSNAPADPTAGDYSNIGAPTNLQKHDWVFSGKYFTSMSYSSTVSFRFVADLTNVSDMDSMFCEALAARIGMEVCGRLTQSTEKTKLIASIYKEHESIAILKNAIIQGSEQPPLDDWIATRA